MVFTRAAALGFALLAAACGASAASWMAGPDGAPMGLSQAIARAQDGDTVELLPGVYRQVLEIDQRKLTLRGVGAQTPVIDGEGKVRSAHAMWTVRGGQVTLENLAFRGMRSSDGGGAGVRQEGGRLTVQRCSFTDNEHGLLSTNVDGAELRIVGSLFGQAPQVRGGLYHLLNVGRIGLLHITGSRFQQGFEGHLIKSRAREAFIGYNFINDGVHGHASYEIELALGGVATVIGNVVAQGVDGANPTLLAYGSEGGSEGGSNDRSGDRKRGRGWERNALYVAHNTFVNYGWLPALFVRVFSDRLPDKVPVFLVNNLAVGPGLLWPAGGGQSMGNRYATRGMLRDIWTNGFELPPDSVWRGSGVDPRDIGGRSLAPEGEFEWPGVVHELPAGRSSWSPGAFQR